MGVQHKRPERIGHNKKSTLLRTFVWIVCIGLAVTGAAALYAANALAPVAASNKQVRVTIPKGTGSGGIAEILQNKRLIRSAFMFKLYLRYKNEGSGLQAGVYAFKPGMTLAEITAKLNAGDTVKEEMVRFTIPEGFTVVQIADKLSDEHIVNRQAFLNEVKSGVKWDSASAARIPYNPQLKYRLEGYLFPETYEMKKGSSETQIVARMLQELDSKLKQLPTGWESQLKIQNINFHQMMTIASLIEREVVLEHERPLVAGVIYNRLHHNMKLQIDATVQYIFEKQKERLLYKDLQVKSPFNTYLHYGLPPGPIAEPSLSSIKAALYPAPTQYLFYVTKKDGSQGHLFAETFKQHQQNIEKSKR